MHPLGELADVLHAHDAILVVDASQAAGAMAMDWRASGVDALAASGYKWLFGPSGTGILWVRSELRDTLTNVNGNWLAVEGARRSREADGRAAARLRASRPPARCR